MQKYLKIAFHNESELIFLLEMLGNLLNLLFSHIKIFRNILQLEKSLKPINPAGRKKTGQNIAIIYILVVIILT